MLLGLSIRNIVLIEQLDLAFERGFTVLSGETGSGKSILFDALGLALGARADISLLRHGAEQGSVTAEFDITGNDGAAALLEEYGVPAEATLMLRRSVSADGKSRAFVNDQPVGLAALKAFAGALVEIHGQHDQRGLLSSATHRTILDAYAELEQQVNAVEAAYADWHEAQNACRNAEEKRAAAEREESYLRHMAEELGALDPKPDEETRLAEKRQRMMEGEKYAETLRAILSALGGQTSARNQIASAERIIVRAPSSAAELLKPVAAALDRAHIELADAEEKLEMLVAEGVGNPVALEAAEERLFALRDAARKYRCGVDDLPALLEKTRASLASLDRSAEYMKALDVRLAETRGVFLKEAYALSEARTKAAKRLESAVMKELKPLKMEHTRFAVSIESLPEEAWGATGVDSVQFLAATNPGQPLSPLMKIASGGELSRFMLALKVVLARVSSMPVLVFDEIDTGIGGATAEAVGKRLAELAKHVQVLAVTHLPQVAAFGTAHYRISKRVKGKAAITEVQALGSKERQEELARMLAGEEISEEARAAAGRLMKVS